MRPADTRSKWSATADGVSASLAYTHGGRLLWVVVDADVLASLIENGDLEEEESASR